MTEEQTNLVQQLRGRAAFCRDRGEIKTPELLEAAAQRVEDAEAAQALVVERAAEVDWQIGRDATDTAPDYLSNWQRGLVAGQQMMRDAIRSLASDTGKAALAALRAERDAARRDHRAVNHMAEFAENEIRMLTGPRDGVAASNIRYSLRQILKWSGRYLTDEPAPERDTLAASLAAAQAEVTALREALQDPLVVHLNMVAGKIAKPLPSQLVHIYGEEAIRTALAANDSRNDKEGG